jgi:hypothetical protein
MRFAIGDLVLYNTSTCLIKSWAEGSPRKSLAVVIDIDESNDYALMYYFANNRAIWTLINDKAIAKYGSPYTLLSSLKNHPEKN